ncbi:MAG: hypothetical protein QXT68_06495 [Halobacteria archaeon]
MDPPARPPRGWTRPCLWAVAACLFLSLAGLHYDVGRHLVSPRDAFWSPTHLLIYVPLLSAEAVTLACLFTFLRRPEGAGDGPGPGVRLSFLARPVPVPLLFIAVGLFLVPLGGLFDQWWHANLGERETLYSLSHIFTIMGGAMAGLGVLLAMGRAPGGESDAFIPLAFGGFLVLAGLMTGPFDYAGSEADYDWFLEHRAPGGDPTLNRFETSRAWGLHRQNGLLFPPVAAAATLPLLALLRRTSSRRWAATEAALFYTAARALLAFALSPGTDRWPFLAPPLPVVVPALLADLSARRKRGPAATGGAAGFAFGLALAATTGAWHPLGLAGAAAAGAAGTWAARPVAALLAGVTPRQAVGLVLLLGAAVPLALGMFDLKVRGLV